MHVLILTPFYPPEISAAACERYAHDARAYAERHFSPDAVGQAYAHILEKATHR
jgi:hypothetical protein